jgi:hypothetical protein
MTVSAPRVCASRAIVSRKPARKRSIARAACSRLVEEPRVGFVEERDRDLPAQLVQDLALAREVVVDRALGHARRGRDLVERGTRDAVAVEAFERRIDDRRPRHRRRFLGPAHRSPRYIRTGTYV